MKVLCWRCRKEALEDKRRRAKGDLFGLDDFKNWEGWRTARPTGVLTLDMINHAIVKMLGGPCPVECPEEDSNLHAR